MDEQKLAGLFRDAAQDAPPASFDAGDVRTASRKATLRRRNSIAAGTTLVVVLGFGGIFAANGWTGGGESTSTSAEGGQQNDNGAQSPMTALQAPPTNFTGKDDSTQGEKSAPGSTGPSAGESAVQGCAGVDRELADALAAELSVSPGPAVSSNDAVAPAVTCPPDARAAAFTIDGLTITAIVSPQPFEAPAAAARVRTTGGQELYVFTQGDGELKGQAQRFADALAPRF
ncbi:hypothetical protein [Lentzea albida]|uniref:Uncharacterized protein n=1 Tax=Lentzea albida TaxID=65499 RepID=A0A1H9NKS1_9PSEU|nr:hypothetical protein [Lentzea albida]SER36491.1 hypothetical protein SAMN04488000_108201 [Lentzea albida]